VVRQLRKPMKVLTESDKDEDWTESFFHTLDGQISGVSQRGQEVLVLYHVIEEDRVRHRVRLYYPKENVFEYTDMLLPGSTWIDSISLQEDSIILSRDPDQYQFQLIPLPLFKSPLMTVVSSEPGKKIERTFPSAIEQYPVSLSRLYSSTKDTYRVLIHNLYKTDSEFSASISIVDNTTLADGAHWREWAYTEDNHTIYYDETMNNPGFADATLKERLNNIRKRPKISLALSEDRKTIVFPSVGNSFFSFDFTDRIDILKKMESERRYLYPIDYNRTDYLNEYYYQRRYEIDSEADILGIELNEDATRMAIWTERQMVYIYSRYNDTEQEDQEKTMWEEWIDLLFVDDDEEYRLYRDYLPLPWKIEMAIIPSTSASIGQVKFHQQFIFVAHNNGHIYSYRLNEREEQRPVNFITFINDKWDMLIAMCAIIAIFVYNESQYA
ncbi:hypothetical protein CU098_001823, partial [Rhizopus stolonifer]